MRITPTSFILLAMIVVCTMPLAMAYEIKDGQKHGDIDRVNSDIEVGRDAMVGDIDSVNGNIEIGAGSQAGKIDVVNGDIELAANVTVKSAETVNGDIKTQSNVTINGGVETVNGEIKLDTGTHVSGNIENVNGNISLTGTHADNDLETVNGDIRLTGETQIMGTLYVRKNKGHNFCIWSCDSNKSIIEIGPQAKVANIVLEREVELHIDANAKVGKIERLYEQDRK